MRGSIGMIYPVLKKIVMNDSDKDAKLGGVKTHGTVTQE